MVGSRSAVAAEADTEVEWRGIGIENFITFVPTSTADDEAEAEEVADDRAEAREESPERLAPREGLFLLLLDFITYSPWNLSLVRACSGPAIASVMTDFEA